MACIFLHTPQKPLTRCCWFNCQKGSCTFKTFLSFLSQIQLAKSLCTLQSHCPPALRCFPGLLSSSRPRHAAGEGTQGPGPGCSSSNLCRRNCSALMTLLTLGHFQMAALGTHSTRASQLVAAALSCTCNNFWRRENHLGD